ncbi:MAG: Pelagibacter phage [Bacteroidota bacterium]|jgi:hypothetical protein
MNRRLIKEQENYAPESGTTKGSYGNIDGRLQAINTYEDLNYLIKSAIEGKKWDVLKKYGIDFGSGGIKTVYDLWKYLGKLPDDKKTGTFLDKLNIDDNFSKIVDDSIENGFLNIIAQAFSTKTGELPNDFNINKELQTYIKDNYNKRTVATIAENKGNNKVNKYSSFKEQQLITEAWRNYALVEQQPVVPQQTQQRKDLQSFQSRQSQITTINKEIVSQKVVDYLETLKGLDINKNKQAIIDGLLLIINKLKAAQPTQQQAQPTQQIKEEIENIYEGAHLDDGTLVCEACLQELLESDRLLIQEAKYQGRTVTLNKPMKGDVKKSKVYVRDPQTGNIKKVNFGDKNMKIKKNIPARRKSFRARHNCDNPGPKTKAKYWSCKAW